MTIRLIPRLDIKGPNLVKGIHLEGLRVLGKPAAFARRYYDEGADELLFMDVVASLYGRNSILETISQTADEVFIPLGVGGGLRSIDDIRAVLRAGADKAVINTAAVTRPEFITDAAMRFGSSTIVVSIEAIKQGNGRYEAYTDGGRERTGLDAVDWARRAADLGAGEIVITSVDREGTGKGYDLDLTRAVSEAVGIPVIACGGAGSAADVADAFAAGADAVSLASVVHYDTVRHLAQDTEAFAPAINLAHLARQGFGNIEPMGVAGLKAALASRQIECRPIPHAA